MVRQRLIGEANLAQAGLSGKNDSGTLLSAASKARIAQSEPLLEFFRVSFSSANIFFVSAINFS